MNYEMMGEMTLSDITGPMNYGLAVRYAPIVKEMYAKMGAVAFENMVAAFNGAQTGTPMDQATALARLSKMHPSLADSRNALGLYTYLKTLSVSSTYQRQAKVTVQAAGKAPVVSYVDMTAQIGAAAVTARNAAAVTSVTPPTSGATGGEQARIAADIARANAILETRANQVVQLNTPVVKGSILAVGKTPLVPPPYIPNTSVTLPDFNPTEKPTIQEDARTNTYTDTAPSTTVTSPSSGGVILDDVGQEIGPAGGSEGTIPQPEVKTGLPWMWIAAAAGLLFVLK